MLNTSANNKGTSRGFACEAPARLDDEFAVTHDEPAVDLDSATTRNDVDVDGGVPIGSGELRVGVAEGDM